MSRVLLTLAALLLAALAGCGDPVADGDYRGEPLMRIEGRIEGDARTSTIRAPYVGIIWLVWDLYSQEGTGRVITSLVEVPASSFPGAFHLDLYDRPPAEAYTELFGVRYAMGAIVALDDVDGNRRFEVDPETGSVAAPDQYFGSSFWYQMLIYVEGVDDAGCALALWEDPDHLVPGRYQLAEMDVCGLGYRPLPLETAIRLILFPPSSELPNGPPNQVEPDCEDVGPDCEFDDDDPRCGAWEAPYLCQLERCVGPSLDFDVCMNDHCLEAFDPWTCADRYCAAEQRAMQGCLEDHCSGNELCTYF